MKIGKIIASTFLSVIVCCVSFSGCTFLRYQNRVIFEEAYDYFSGKGAKEFHKIKAKTVPRLDGPLDTDNYVFFRLEIDEEEYKSHYGEDENYLDTSLANFKGGLLEVCGKNLKILRDNGFFEIETREVYAYYTSNSAIFGDKWYFPIVGVQTDDKVYLDEETGKANYLEYLQEQIKYYS